MADIKRMKASVGAVIRKLDPKVIPEGMFYDDASGQLFVTIFKGPRKVSVALRERDFSDGDTSRVNRAIEEGLARLQRTPIG